MPDGESGDSFYVACRICGQPHEMQPLAPGTIAKCVRCDSQLIRCTRDSVNRTFAFSLAALLLYLPANLFPILRLNLYGSTSDSTVWDGVKMFYRDGQWIMAIVVLLASIVIPAVKLIGLMMLVCTTRYRMTRAKKFRTYLYRFIDVIGRWAMLDIFVLAIWVAVVKLDRLGSVTPGAGLLPFGSVVLLTLFAAASFDPRLIWEFEPIEQKRQERQQ